MTQDAELVLTTALAAARAARRDAERALDALLLPALVQDRGGDVPRLADFLLRASR